MMVLGDVHRIMSGYFHIETDDGMGHRGVPEGYEDKVWWAADVAEGIDHLPAQWLGKECFVEPFMANELTVVVML